MNLLFLVAGYQHYDKFGDLTAEGLRIHFDINAIGPLLMVQALRQNLQAGTQVSLSQPARLPDRPAFTWGVGSSSVATLICCDMASVKAPSTLRVLLMQQD